MHEAAAFSSLQTSPMASPSMCSARASTGGRSELCGTVPNSIQKILSKLTNCYSIHFSVTLMTRVLLGDTSSGPALGDSTARCSFFNLDLPQWLGSTFCEQGSIGTPFQSLIDPSDHGNLLMKRFPWQKVGCNMTAGLSKARDTPTMSTITLGHLPVNTDSAFISRL